MVLTTALLGPADGGPVCSAAQRSRLQLAADRGVKRRRRLPSASSPAATKPLRHVRPHGVQQWFIGQKSSQLVAAERYRISSIVLRSCYCWWQHFGMVPFVLCKLTCIKGTVFYWIRNWSHIATHLFLGQPSSKSVRLRCFKWGRDQIWQNCSSSKYTASIDGVGLSMWRRAFKTVASCHFTQKSAANWWVHTQHTPGFRCVCPPMQQRPPAAR